jgi:hypothetical protein
MRWMIIGICMICAAQERMATNGNGDLIALLDNDDELPVRVTTNALDAELKFAVEGPSVRATGLARALRPVDFIRVEVPREMFLNGSVTAGGASAALGPSRIKGDAILASDATEWTLATPHRKLTVMLPPGGARLQERWDARPGRRYVLEVPFRGQTDVRLVFNASPEASPATARIETAKTRGKLNGFGGNYCFGIESPVAAYTLENLKHAWARTEMTLTEWEPENDDADPDTANWLYFEARDQPGSNLRREFEMMQALQRKGVPYAASIWWLPEWMLADPHMKPRSEHRRRVGTGKWEELLESVGAYLLYARKKYGAEPDLFSFNEANIGVYVLFDPEEHRDAIKSFGAYFRKLGLKTRLLLADATGPDGTYTYALPAANDPEALQYCGAVAFHSWGGTTPERYRLWGEVAEWLNLPLLVAEAGVDAGAHRQRRYDSYHYGLREVKQYQDLLEHARPQGIIFWEYTSDYGLLKVIREGQTEQLEPTPRYHFMRHWANLTPRDSDNLVTSSSQERVRVTAFRGAAGFTVHIANLGPACELALDGLPPGEYRRVVTSATEGFAEKPRIEAGRPTTRLALPGRALITLTTVR